MDDVRGVMSGVTAVFGDSLLELLALARRDGIPSNEALSTGVGGSLLFRIMLQLSINSTRLVFITNILEKNPYGKILVVTSWW